MACVAYPDPTMKITEALAAGPTYSFEFFPPKTPEASETLSSALVELEPLAPSFVSVTYGAGGGTRELTHDIVTRFRRDSSITPMAHLTCVCHTRGELEAIARRYGTRASRTSWRSVAIRPRTSISHPASSPTQSSWCTCSATSVTSPSGSRRSRNRIRVRRASWPIARRTAEKLAEADFAITQFFFDPEHYFDLVSSLADLGVHKPVIPGIMPATAISSIKRMTELQGSEFPSWLSEKLYAVQDDPEAVFRVGVEEATKLSQALLAGGAPGLHFITLNRSRATRLIYDALGLTPAS